MEYTYDIALDTLSGTVAPATLTKELIAAGIAGFTGIEVQPGAGTGGADLVVVTADNEEGDNIAPVIAAHITLDEQRITRKKSVDVRTRQLISAGASYDSKSFSLSIPAQANWLGIKALEALLTFPLKITTITDEEYSLTAANVDAFVGAMAGTKQAHLDSGRALKVSIDGAADQNALDGIIDNR